MNERMKNFYDQVGLDFENFQRVTVTKGDMEKFAELIVAECLDVALAQKKWVKDQVAFDPRDATWNEARIQQSQRIVEKIKQHFGVEE